MTDVHEARWNIIKSMLEESPFLKERTLDYLKA